MSNINQLAAKWRGAAASAMTISENSSVA